VAFPELAFIDILQIKLGLFTPYIFFSFGENSETRNLLLIGKGAIKFYNIFLPDKNFLREK